MLARVLWVSVSCATSAPRAKVPSRGSGDTCGPSDASFAPNAELSAVGGLIVPDCEVGLSSDGHNARARVGPLISPNLALDRREPAADCGREGGREEMRSALAAPPARSPPSTEPDRVPGLPNCLLPFARPVVSALSNIWWNADMTSATEDSDFVRGRPVGWLDDERFERGAGGAAAAAEEELCCCCCSCCCCFASSACSRAASSAHPNAVSFRSYTCINENDRHETRGDRWTQPP